MKFKYCDKLLLSYKPGGTVTIFKRDVFIDLKNGWRWLANKLFYKQSI